MSDSRWFKIPEELRKRVLNNGDALADINDDERERINSVLHAYEGVDLPAYFIIIEGVHQGKLEEILTTLENSSDNLRGLNPNTRRLDVYTGVGTTNSLFNSLYKKLGVYEQTQ